MYIIKETIIKTINTLNIFIRVQYIEVSVAIQIVFEPKCPNIPEPPIPPFEP
jgi:hypothetical protein